MADEVYQENIWNNDTRFESFRKVAYELDAFSGDKTLQLISFHSISKGFLGECGLRGGYFELLGIPDNVRQEIYKLASISLCSNTIGQIATGLMVRTFPLSLLFHCFPLIFFLSFNDSLFDLQVRPPVVGDASYPLYVRERDAVLQSLARRAARLREALASLRGVRCSAIAGALYGTHLSTLILLFLTGFRNSIPFHRASRRGDRGCAGAWYGT
jgi:alanine transaminase